MLPTWSAITYLLVIYIPEWTKANRNVFNRIAVWVLLFGGSAIYAQSRPAVESSKREQALKAFLQSYVNRARLPNDNRAEYRRAFVDLNADGKDEAIVYLSGRWWCGTGGCPTLILRPKDGSFRLITRVLITRPPIRLLNTTSNGWHDISVLVAGGGVSTHEARLQFNGKGYPMNPSVPPARPVAREMPGRTLIKLSDVAVSLAE